MPDYPELLVLRHGQTEWNVQERYQGHRDSPLTPLGLTQAAAQGRILEEVLRGAARPCFCSPQPRAKRTADIALGHNGLVATPEPRLMEVGFGLWEGRTRVEIEQSHPEMSGYDRHRRLFSAPGGESLSALKARCESFLSDLSEPSIIVSHGITTAILRGLWLGLSEQDMLSLPKGQGCVYQLSQGGEQCLTL